MSDQVSEIHHALSSEDEEFQRWDEQHHQYEARLAELAGKPTLTSEEEVEERLLKKRKLHLKDQMAAKLRGREH